MENIKLAGRGIRRLVTLYAPLSRLIAEHDRRHRLMVDHDLLIEEINLEDPHAVLVKAE